MKEFGFSPLLSALILFGYILLLLFWLAVNQIIALGLFVLGIFALVGIIGVYFAWLKNKKQSVSIFSDLTIGIVGGAVGGALLSASDTLASVFQTAQTNAHQYANNELAYGIVILLSILTILLVPITTFLCVWGLISNLLIKKK